MENLRLLQEKFSNKYDEFYEFYHFLTLFKTFIYWLKDIRW